MPHSRFGTRNVMIPLTWVTDDNGDITLYGGRFPIALCHKNTSIMKIEVFSQHRESIAILGIFDIHDDFQAKQKCLDELDEFIKALTGTLS